MVRKVRQISGVDLGGNAPELIKKEKKKKRERLEAFCYNCLSIQFSFLVALELCCP